MNKKNIIRICFIICLFMVSSFLHGMVSLQILERPIDDSSMVRRDLFIGVVYPGGVAGGFREHFRQIFLVLRRIVNEWEAIHKKSPGNSIRLILNVSKAEIDKIREGTLDSCFYPGRRIVAEYFPGDAEVYNCDRPPFRFRTASRSDRYDAAVIALFNKKYKQMKKFLADEKKRTRGVLRYEGLQSISKKYRGIKFPLNVQRASEPFDRLMRGIKKDLRMAGLESVLEVEDGVVAKSFRIVRAKIIPTLSFSEIVSEEVLVPTKKFSEYVSVDFKALELLRALLVAFRERRDSEVGIVICGLAKANLVSEMLCQTGARKVLYVGRQEPSRDIEISPDSFLSVRQLERFINKTINRCCACGADPSDARPLKQCARCKKVFYCSVACQRAAWQEHKRFCSEFDEDEQEEVVVLSEEIEVGGVVDDAVADETARACGSESMQRRPCRKRNRD